jgi:PAS domain S-box-containing protein
MENGMGSQSEVETLRQKAEELLKKNSTKKTSIDSDDEKVKLTYELEVHQIELVMQNEYLRVANEEKNVATQKYTELYDLVPSGYFTLSSKGEIIELNLHGASMLGKERQHLKRCMLAFFVSNETKPIFNLFLNNVFNNKDKESCEVTILTDCNLPTYVYLTGIATVNGLQCHITMEDISKRYNAVQELALQNSGLLILNQFAIELSNLVSNDDLEAIITKRVKEISCAEVAIYAEYNSKNRTTTTKHIVMESGLLEKVVSLLGKKIQDIHSVVSDEDYQAITREMFGIRETLYEASFGAIPRPVGAAIQALLKVDRIIGIAYMIEGKLYGTSILLMGKGKPDPSKAILENFIHLAALSLRRKKADEALKINEEKYRTLFNNSEIGMFRTRLEGSEILEFNEKFLKILNYTFEEVKGSPSINMWANKHEREKLVELIKTVGHVTDFECELYNKQGDVKNCITSLQLYPDSGFLEGSIQDITKRKKVELELIKAKEKAEESDRLKSAFLANISHEVRTPMNGILGFTELLKEPNLTNEEQQDYIRTIELCGERMQNTLNDILDFSKIESGLTKVANKESNINGQTEFIYKSFKPEVESKGLQLLFKNGLPSKEAIIKTDIEKIHTILTDLIKNAIKFTNEGSIEFGYEKKGEYLEFFVKDTGVGIPQKQQQIIFERFRQGSESFDRMYEGNGLGLSISKSYVEMLGGKLWVESEERKGSIFYFTIPYNAVSEEKSTIENDVSEKDKEVQLKKLNVLVAEDDEVSFSLLTRNLQKISKEVIHAKTGLEAVLACRKYPDLNLVLMDIKMPDMDGHEATRQIRLFNKDIIIIAQTAFVLSNEREKAIEAGCNEYITKPVNMTILFELIKKYFNK